MKSLLFIILFPASLYGQLFITGDGNCKNHCGGGIMAGNEADFAKNSFQGLGIKWTSDSTLLINSYFTCGEYCECIHFRDDIAVYERQIPCHWLKDQPHIITTSPITGKRIFLAYRYQNGTNSWIYFVQAIETRAVAFVPNLPFKPVSRLPISKA